MRLDESVTAFVLKKQTLGEADVLVTWYTKESGKIRTLVKAARRPQSRLAFLIQEGSIVRIRLVGRNEHSMPILAGGSITNAFHTELTQTIGVLLAWLSELFLKTTPDAEHNAALYAIGEQFLYALGESCTAAEYRGLVAHTTMSVLTVLGLAIHEEPEPRFFSCKAGGFFAETESTDAVPISAGLWQEYQAVLAHEPGAALLSVSPDLLAILQAFLEYQLERPIRSFAFVNDIIGKDSTDAQISQMSSNYAKASSDR